MLEFKKISADLCVSETEIIMILRRDSIKEDAIIKNAKEVGCLIDATGSSRRRCTVLLKNGTVVMSALELEEIAGLAVAEEDEEE